MTDKELDEVISAVRTCFIEAGTIRRRAEKLESTLESLLQFLERYRTEHQKLKDQGKSLLEEVEDDDS
jgi:hypothetical protein